jgi:shikimate kinase
MRIFLTGFMGSGKTTLGKKLAAKLGYTFIDLDHVFEEREQLTITEYFKTYGEKRFREQESILIKTAIYPQNAVVSTGGGAPCYFDNMEWMNANGTTVYIQLPPRVLAHRLEHDSNQRPVLMDKQGDALVAFIEDKLKDREPFYQKAQITANGIGLTAEKLWRTIEERSA